MGQAPPQALNDVLVAVGLELTRLDRTKPEIRYGASPECPEQRENDAAKFCNTCRSLLHAMQNINCRGHKCDKIKNGKILAGESDRAATAMQIAATVANHLHLDRSGYSAINS